MAKAKKSLREPPAAEAERCFQLRCRGKRGEYLSPEDSAFLAKMYKQYPVWYGQQEARVFNATVPFGSTVRKPEE